MHWTFAVTVARQQYDVTYEEWCDLYYDHINPTREQIEKCTKTAHAILVRNILIPDDPINVSFTGLEDGWVVSS